MRFFTMSLNPISYLVCIARAPLPLFFPYRWPKSRPLYERPTFLKKYPCPEGQLYNVNSFLGRMDAHGGKYYVPPSKYKRFLEVGLLVLRVHTYVKCKYACTHSHTHTHTHAYPHTHKYTHIHALTHIIHITRVY
jgi:hypothetical protein